MMVSQNICIMSCDNSSSLDINYWLWRVCASTMKNIFQNSAVPSEPLANPEFIAIDAVLTTLILTTACKITMPTQFSKI
jgi:hypothetical protein